MATPFRSECIKQGGVQEGDHHFCDILPQDHLSKIRNDPPEGNSDEDHRVNELTRHR